MITRRLAPLLLCLACGGPDAALGADAGAGPTALFELARGAPISEFYALPYPNDLRRKADGTIDLADHKAPNDLVKAWIAAAATRTPGFGTNAPIYVRFSTAIDAATLPSTGLEEGASVYLVDVSSSDRGDRGKRWPLRFHFSSAALGTIGENWLACQPFPGFPLRPLTTYALVVTRRVRAPGGAPVGRAADFEALMSGGGDAAVARARTVYAPLLTWLDGGGEARAEVVDAAVFTTQDPTSLVGKLRAAIAALPAPSAREVKKTSPTTTFDTFEGLYDGPNFQSGEAPYFNSDGEIFVDDAGRPIVQRSEAMRFALTVPKGEVPTGGWPIAIYFAGTGGNYRTFIGEKVAERMAQKGLAVISIDPMLAGARVPPGSAEAEITFINLQNLPASRDNVRQGAADGFSLVRLLPDLEVVDGATHHSFDERRIFFIGHSQGGLTGVAFLAFEPSVKGAVLSGTGGHLTLLLLNKTLPADVASLISVFVKDQPFDEFNNILAIVQAFAEGGDNTNYAPLLVRAPPAGVPPKDIFHSDGVIDHVIPSVGIEALAVAGGFAPVSPVLRPVAGMDLFGVTALTAPVSGNLGGRTAVFLQYAQRAGSDGHFVWFDIEAARRQADDFLSSLAQTGTATLGP